MALLNRQKQDLFRAIEAHGFAPELFEYTEGPDIEASASLQYRGSIYRCAIFRSAGSPDMNVPSCWVVESVPGSGFLRGSAQTRNWNTGVMNRVKEWLNRLDEELNTPDPWEALRAQRGPQFSAPMGTPNTPLTVSEWETIQAGIEQICVVLCAEASRIPNAVEEINEKLDRLIDAGRRMGRVDWMNQAIGVIMNIIVVVALSEDAQRRVWELLKATVAGVAHLIPLTSPLLSAG